MNTVKIADHKISSLDSYLFDTNVWLYIFGPMAGTSKKKQSVYTGLLRKIMDRRATIFVTSLVLAEYFNAVLQMGFKQWKRSTKNFNAEYKRDYRNTEDFDNVLKDLFCQIEEILKIAEKKPDDFCNLKIESVLSSVDRNADYNDVYLASICEKCSGLKLVSDDVDMQCLQKDIILITA